MNKLQSTSNEQRDLPFNETTNQNNSTSFEDESENILPQSILNQSEIHLNNPPDIQKILNYCTKLENINRRTTKQLKEAKLKIQRLEKEVCTINNKISN